MDHYVFSAVVLVLLYSGAVLGPHVRQAWQITLARQTRLSRCGDSARLCPSRWCYETAVV
jgi:hypothetical protein